MGVILEEVHLKAVQRLRKQVWRTRASFVIVFVMLITYSALLAYDHSMTSEALSLIRAEVERVLVKQQVVEMLRTKPLTIGQVLDVVDVMIDQTKKSDVPLDMVLGIMSVESDFHSGAISPKGAKGLMQIMPQTFALYVGELGVSPSAIFDPASNVRAGILHLGNLFRENRDWQKVLREYNTGKSTVRSPEVDQYVRVVMKRAEQFKSQIN